MFNYLRITGKQLFFISAVAVFTFFLGVFIAIPKKTNLQASKLPCYPSEKPLPLLTTKENKGEHCQALAYSIDPKDNNYNPYCYELQQQLHHAINEGNLTTVKEALSLGANPDGQVGSSNPPLFFAASKGYSDIVRTLLDNGAYIHRELPLQGTALNVAVTAKHTEVIKLLLARGADPCIKNEVGTSFDAAQKNKATEIEALLNIARPCGCL